METYFKANFNAIKFRHTPLTFLNLLQELFNKFFIIESNAKSINKAIKSCINPKIFIATASQATDSVSKRKEEEDKEETKKDFKEKLA